eukprot:m.242905 g.242905  ORF g.242905 m.242905 type:complete len:76 (+) comp17139_c0_seq4:1002-1229(+)
MGSDGRVGDDSRAHDNRKLCDPFLLHQVGRLHADATACHVFPLLMFNPSKRHLHLNINELFSLPNETDEKLICDQ